MDILLDNITILCIFALSLLCDVCVLQTSHVRHFLCPPRQLRPLYHCHSIDSIVSPLRQVVYMTSSIHSFVCNYVTSFRHFILHISFSSGMMHSGDLTQCQYPSTLRVHHFVKQNYIAMKLQ